MNTFVRETSNTPRASFKHALVKRSGPEAFPLAPRDTARNTSVVENARSRNASGGPASDCFLTYDYILSINSFLSVNVMLLAYFLILLLFLKLIFTILLLFSFTSSKSIVFV